MVVSVEQVRGFLVERQGLSAGFATPIEALDALFAVQTQYAASLPIAIAARCETAIAGWDEAALRDARVVKSWSLRCTLHAHTPQRHRTMIAAVGDRILGSYDRWMDRRGFGAEFIQGMQERICAKLAAGPMTRADLHKALPELAKIPMAGWGADVMGISCQGRLTIQGSERGSALFGLYSNCDPIDKGEAMADLVRAYLRAYGPATLKDMSYWSGLPVAAVDKAIHRMGDELATVEIEGAKGRRWLLSADLSVLRESSAPDGSVALLAKFDPLLMAHHDKSHVLDDRHKTSVFRKAGQVEAVVLIDGTVRAGWRLERKAKQSVVRLEPFGKLSKAEIKLIDRKMARLAKALGISARLESS